MSTKVAAFDPDGHFLAAVHPGYVTRALARREAVRIPEGIRLRPTAAAAGWHDLTPEEKRRIVLARERARR